MHRRPTAAEPLEPRTLFALTTFTIDPALSVLRLSGEVADVFDIEEQGRGSLSQSYQGTIVVDIKDGGLVAFPGGSNIVARAVKNYDPGDGPANYGVEGETDGPFSVKVGEGAIRNLAFDLESSDLAVSADSGAFPSNGITVETTAGVFEFDLRVGGDGEVDLDDEDDVNDAAGNATLRGAGDNRTLTIPLDFTLGAGSTELRFRGTLVATTGSGAPVDPNAVRIGDGTLLKAVQFTEADGTLATVTITGGGSADVRFANATQVAPGKTGAVIVSGTGVQFLGVDATGSASRTKLAINGKGGADNVVNVPSVTTDGGAASIGGKGVVFAGNVAVGGHLAALSATRLTGATVTADSLGTVKVAGDVTDSTLTLDAPFAPGAFAVRTLTVTGGFTNSRLAAIGNVGVVKVRTMTGSEIYSGVTEGAARFPATTELAASGSIGNVTAKTFADSVLAAATLGKLKFGTVTTANAAAPFGLTADIVGGLQATNEARQRLRLLVVDTQSGLDAQLALQTFDFGDFAIRLA